MQEILYETIPSLDLDDFHKGNAAKKQSLLKHLVKLIIILDLSLSEITF